MSYFNFNVMKTNHEGNRILIHEHAMNLTKVKRKLKNFVLNNLKDSITTNLN